MNHKLAIKSKRILTPEGVREGIILIEKGEISAVIPANAAHEGFTIEDVGDLLVMPGVIDPHVHINEPGRTDWEGFETATKAAAKGGITTLIDMPLNSSPVTTSVNNFHIKTAASMGQLHVNCGFWGGVVPDNLNELDALLQSGVFGLKAFLTHSGIDDFPNTEAEHLRIALTLLKKYDKPLLVHCELDEAIPEAELLTKNPRSYDAYLKSRPASWENKAIALMIKLCRETGARVHIVHLSSAEAIAQIKAAKAEGLPITVETGQHYLFFNAEQINDGATEFKCAPPIREKENNEQLWKALKDLTIDFIATDHSPAPPELKEIGTGNFQKAWGGIAGLQFALPVVWTAAKERGFTLEQVSKWLSTNIAGFLHLHNSKGKIMKGYDADLVIWDPEKQFIVAADDIQHRHKVSPYIGQQLTGVVEQTYVYGQKVYDHENYLHLNAGKILLKK
jgi:allantoinase